MTTPPSAEDRRSATEARLRAALTARAAQVTHRDLRREAPPRGRGRTVRARITGARYGPALAALATAAVAAVGLLFLLPDRPLPPTPVLPARPPGVTDPRPPAPSPTSLSTETTPRVVTPSG